MKYAYIRDAQKSHCDYPSPFVEENIKTSDDNFDEVVNRITKGCEDVDVKMLTKEQYDKHEEDIHKMFADEIEKDRPLTEEKERAVKFAYWNWL